MLKKFWTFVICLGLSLGVITFLKIWDKSRLSTQPSQTDQKLCNYAESKTTFSKKHYFSREQVEGLLGKKVQNLKCGKIKCAVGLGNCQSVQIGEIGTIKAFQPRFGYDDFLLIVEWETDESDESWGVALAEQNPDKLFSYLGNDQSFKFVK
jgi:hypothetical protein